MTTTYALATKNIEYQSFFLRVPQKFARQLNFIQLCLGTTLFLSVFVPRKSIADVCYQISSADTIIDSCKLQLLCAFPTLNATAARTKL